MRNLLVEADLWDRGNPADPVGSISNAWKVLARAGAACRYSGLSPDGQHEFLLLDPRSGSLLGSGRGHSTPEALCKAALALRHPVRNA